MSKHEPIISIAREVAQALGEPQAAGVFSAWIKKPSNMPYPILEVTRSRHVTEGTGADLIIVSTPHAEEDVITTDVRDAVTAAVHQVVRLRRRLHAIVDHAARTGRNASADRGWATVMHAVTRAVLTSTGQDPAAAVAIDPEVEGLTSETYRSRCWRGLPAAAGIILQGDRARAALEWTKSLQFDDMKGPPRVTCPGQHMPISMLQAAVGRPLREVIAHPTFDLIGDDVIVTHAEDAGVGAQFHLNDVVVFAELPPAAADMRWADIGTYNPLLTE